jgi:hypothetical protein
MSDSVRRNRYLVVAGGIKVAERNFPVTPGSLNVIDGLLN